jgi:hypothetical protein
MKNGDEWISKLLHSKHCDFYPDCVCNQTLCHWQDKLSEDAMNWEITHLAWAETSIFLALSCVAYRCPERRVKAWAQRQLLNKYWNRQRAGIDLTEVFGQRGAAQQ